MGCGVLGHRCDANLVAQLMCGLNGIAWPDQSQDRADTRLNCSSVDRNADVSTRQGRRQRSCRGERGSPHLSQSPRPQPCHDPSSSLVISIDMHDRLTEGVLHMYMALRTAGPGQHQEDLKALLQRVQG
jgi:hypothetical protein